MNRQATTRVATALTVALAVLAGPEAHAGIKCWMNDEGVRECGNAVPPRYAQKGHRSLSRQGVTISETERAKTPEELEEERRAAEQEMLAKREADRLARESAARDRVLLDTFTTEEDLLLARDDKLASIDSRIRHTDEVIERLQLSLEELQGEAAKLERGGKSVPDDLRASIEKVERQIDENRALIDHRHGEKQELAERFNADLARYRELKGIR